jgi:hypothetical protein
MTPMTKVTRVANADGEHLGWMIQCPACQCGHLFGPGWTFNGDQERPTFTPSMLVRSGHYAPGHKDGAGCWCTYNAEHPDQPAPFVCSVCHSFVTDGRIQFLGDCTHAMAGQTVDLEAVD